MADIDTLIESSHSFFRKFTVEKAFRNMDTLFKKYVRKAWKKDQFMNQLYQIFDFPVDENLKTAFDPPNQGRFRLNCVHFYLLMRLTEEQEYACDPKILGVINLAVGSFHLDGTKSDDQELRKCIFNFLSNVIQTNRGQCEIRKTKLDGIIDGLIKSAVPFGLDTYKSLLIIVQNLSPETLASREEVLKNSMFCSWLGIENIADLNGPIKHIKPCLELTLKLRTSDKQIGIDEQLLLKTCKQLFQRIRKGNLEAKCNGFPSFIEMSTENAQRTKALVDFLSDVSTINENSSSRKEVVWSDAELKDIYLDVFDVASRMGPLKESIPLVNKMCELLLTKQNIKMAPNLLKSMNESVKFKHYLSSLLSEDMSEDFLSIFSRTFRIYSFDSLFPIEQTLPTISTSIFLKLLLKSLDKLSEEVLQGVEHPNGFHISSQKVIFTCAHIVNHLVTAESPILENLQKYYSELHCDTLYESLNRLLKNQTIYFSRMSAAMLNEKFNIDAFPIFAKLIQIALFLLRIKLIEVDIRDEAISVLTALLQKYVATCTFLPKGFPNPIFVFSSELAKNDSFSNLLQCDGFFIPIMENFAGFCKIIASGVDVNRKLFEDCFNAVDNMTNAKPKFWMLIKSRKPLMKYLRIIYTKDVHDPWNLANFPEKLILSLMALKLIDKRLKKTVILFPEKVMVKMFEYALTHILDFLHSMHRKSEELYKEVGRHLPMALDYWKICISKMAELIDEPWILNQLLYVSWTEDAYKCVLEYGWPDRGFGQFHSLIDRLLKSETHGSLFRKLFKKVIRRF